MRAEKPGDRLWARIAAGTAAAGATAVGAMFGGGAGALGGLALGAAGGALAHRQMLARGLRRQRLLATPFPERWRNYLDGHVDHYARIPDALVGRYEDDVRLFLHEKKISGVGLEVSEELRLLVACAAVSLSVGWPDYDWDQLTEVLLYPQDFDRDWSFEDDRELSGQAHPWGTVILSVPSLRNSFAWCEDGFHVGYHEFAHLLALQHGVIEGIPAGVPAERVALWADTIQREMERLRKGKSALDEYGAEEPVEFFAVAVEAFFDIPREMRQRHREIYALFVEYFRQDPAAWDDARRV